MDIRLAERLKKIRGEHGKVTGTDKHANLGTGCTKRNVVFFFCFFFLVFFFFFGGGGLYAVSTVFQLFNGENSQFHASWTIFNSA